MPSTTFNYTGGWQQFNVPADVKVVTVDVRGAGSGAREGGKVVGKLRVRPKDTLFILVGQQGQAAAGVNGGSAAFGGGGRGGDATAGNDGGNGGGGCSAIRLNRKDGPIRAVAGGAGGKSGDNGHGGPGGAEIGGVGDPGTSGGGTVGNATGGTITQSGKGGTSGAGSIYNGNHGENVRLGRGGKGGSKGTARHGGGGGGGGYYPGGGGQAARVGDYPGGGGGGGANWSEPLYDVTDAQGTGGTGNGQVIITWTNPADEPPAPPEDITINGVAISDGLATKATDIILRGTPGDPNASNNGARLVVRLSKSSSFRRWSSHRGDYDAFEGRDKVTINNLTKDTRYYARIHTQDRNGRLSTSYRSTNFWTNRSPQSPNMLSPGDNSQFTDLVNVTFTWNHIDDDPSDSQTAFRIRWRRAGTPLREPGRWNGPHEEVTPLESYTYAAGTFAANRFYEVQVKTRDEQGAWGDWSDGTSFYVYGDATPPTLRQPEMDEAIRVDEECTFRWRFKKPQRRATQTKADIRYRVPTSPGWTTVNGVVDPGVPGSTKKWTFPAETFAPGYPYEWQVRTYSSAGFMSAWSDSSYFWCVPAPDTATQGDVVESGEAAAPLGQGVNRAFIFDRGGKTMRGELKATSIQWSRKRDDISNAIVHIDEIDNETKTLLKGIRTWSHEMVIFRENEDGVSERVWEGPITRITAKTRTVTLESKDVMAYPYRRIMRQGYNDAYRIINGTQVGLKTVIERSVLILLNALAYDNPNVIEHITPITHRGDARQSRRVKDFASTAWEEIDSMAATGGLDYCTAGRRIVLWDTHNPLGRLPEMRAGDFADDPIITEYGMNMANFLAVTNNNGVWGAARRGLDADHQPGPEGWVEILQSAYGEADEPKANRKLSRKARRRLRRSLREQARRSISGRWPAPLVVRVPDNTTLNPNVNVGINQLIPGVWIPVRAEDAIRELTQWQKLDLVTVRQDKDGEKITIVLSPAPNAGEDPDAGTVDEDSTSGTSVSKALAVDDAETVAEYSPLVEAP